VPSPARKSASTRRRPPGRARQRSAGGILWIRVAVACLALVALLLGWAAVARSVAPRSNTARSQFDAIVVLGTPADGDGNPTPEMLDRVTEGVAEYRRGVARRLILSGSAAHNEFIEADVMARVAEAQGVPASAVYEETRALDTIQNACYSEAILKAHGWHSAEVISSAEHLPRAAMIFARLAKAEHLAWRMHAAPANLTAELKSEAAAVVEVLKTARYLVWSRWTEGCQ
jgi:uncharacterized SAM-binding protein YcdF (DUF218 family)